MKLTLRIAIFFISLVTLLVTRVSAQVPRIRQPTFYPGNTINVNPGTPYSGAPVASPGLVPVNPSPYGTSTLGAPSFDPYGTPTGSSPSIFGGSTYSPYSNTPSIYSTPPPVPGAASNPVIPYGANPYGQYGQYGGTPSSPNSLFPDGMFGSGQYDFGSPTGSILQFIQNPRLKHTFLYGRKDRDVAMNDTEVSVTTALPNFFTSGQPLYLSPTFIMHLWDGPQPPATSYLPANAYSAYLDMFYRTDPNLIIGGEFNGSVGVFSDFNTFTTDSIRLQGTALGTMRLTPTLQLKAGVTYLDRMDVKILPAGGFLWEPNPQTRFDIYFPRPKLSQYLTTVGNTDVWWYLAGEYGGGSWTIEYKDGTSERIDINDIRASIGLDWLLHSGAKAFFEVGYVFQREVLYQRHPTEQFDPRDTFMLRGGIAF